MKFGAVPVKDATGCILAHSLTINGQKFQKGLKLSEDEISSLLTAGVATVTVAEIEATDLPEDEAAALLAKRLLAAGMTLSAPFTGRANIFAEGEGLLQVDPARIQFANDVDEAITIATLPEITRVRDRQMLATVKIIPYGASQASVAEVARRLGEGQAMTVHRRAISKASVFLTETPGMKSKLLVKGGAAIEARLTALGVEMEPPVVVPHDTNALSRALAGFSGDMALVLGGSATSDRRDVAPAAVEAAGGRIDRFGMPVDPGNLLFIGELNDKPVIGLPGCARSPKLNGADWVLEKIVAGLPVSSADIAGMGVGGLLKEIPSRPQPREAAIPARPKVSALLLAAGSSSRMRGADKLMELVDDIPLLRLSAEVLLASQVDEVIVVLRPDDPRRLAALDGLNVRVIENPQATEGMGASIRAGIAAVASDAGALLVALADMPDIAANDVDALIAAYDVEDGREIIRAADPTGAPGNPVLFGRRFFEPLRGLEGDEGARSILAANADLVRLVRLSSNAARVDLDTPEAWAEWRAGQT